MEKKPVVWQKKFAILIASIIAFIVVGYIAHYLVFNLVMYARQ